MKVKIHKILYLQAFHWLTFTYIHMIIDINYQHILTRFILAYLTWEIHEWIFAKDGINV